MLPIDNIPFHSGRGRMTHTGFRYFFMENISGEFQFKGHDTILD